MLYLLYAKYIMKNFIKLAILALVFVAFSRQIKEYDEIQLQAKQKQCIVEALHHEAVGESPEGIAAVMSVIHNRLHSGKFGDSYCGVIQQYKQFSYRNHLKQDVPMYVPWYSSAETKNKSRVIHKLADLAVQGSFNSILPKNTYWYHANYVKPKWTKKMQLVKVIGKHKFYTLKAVNPKKKGKL